MLVSICMPTYNGEQFVAQAIESALAQSYKDIELLICDDCSSDSTHLIVQKYAKQDRRIVYWRNESRLGLFANYNECMTQAKGDLIKLFAQDDLLNPNALEQMVSAYTKHKAVLVCCGKRFLTESPVLPVEEVETVLEPGLTPGGTVIEQSLQAYRNLVGEPVCVLFDARRIGSGFSESYYSLGDLEFWFRILQKGDLYFLPEELVTFRQHRKSTTHKMLEDMTWVLDFFRLGKDYSVYLEKLGISQDEYFNGFLERAGELIDRMVANSELTVTNLSGFKEVAYYSMRRAAQLAVKAREYDALVNSTSWRLTGPLRFIKTKIEKKTTHFDRHF